MLVRLLQLKTTSGQINKQQYINVGLQFTLLLLSKFLFNFSKLGLGVECFMFSFFLLFLLVVTMGFLRFAGLCGQFCYAFRYSCRVTQGELYTFLLVLFDTLL